MLNSVSVVF